MKRVPFDIIITLLIGLGLGLAYSWLISPLHVVDSDPIALRADFKDNYRSAIAASYAATNNLPRAQARLALLADTSLIDTLNSQAQRMLASGEFTQADQLVTLANALGNRTGLASALTPTSDKITAIINEPTTTLPPSPQDIPIQLTETPQAQSTDIQIIETQTQPVADIPTPRPTQTLIPTVGAPFALIAQDTVCDKTLPDGLLQILIFNSKHKQIAGAKLVITWDNGEEQFFTGLKPEVGNGYADYSMSPNITYTLRLALGSDIASGLTVPTCQTASGDNFPGGIKLTFQQP